MSVDKLVANKSIDEYKSLYKVKIVFQTNGSGSHKEEYDHSTVFGQNLCIIA